MLSKNREGRPYIKSQGEPTLWNLAITFIEREPNIGPTSLGEKLLVHKGIASRIIKAIREGKTQPLPVGKQAPSYKEKQKNQAEVFKIIVESEPDLLLCEYQERIPKSITVSYSISQLCKLLKKYKLTAKYPNYFHPNKRKGDNTQYYEDFLMWLFEQPIEVCIRHCCVNSHSCILD